MNTFSFMLAILLSLCALQTQGSEGTSSEYELFFNSSPTYPPRALERGIEGHCIVEYTVSAEGTTRNIHAVDCQPAGIFETESIAAASQFKYFPRMVNGKPVDVPGVKNRFTFKLAN